MMKYINSNKIITADILEPYINSGEVWDIGNTRGWQVSFIVGFNEGYPNCIVVDRETKEECIKLTQILGLTPI